MSRILSVIIIKLNDEVNTKVAGIYTQEKEIKKSKLKGNQSSDQKKLALDIVKRCR